MASFLQKACSSHRFLHLSCIHVRRLCDAAAAESENKRMSKEEKELKRRMREEGKRTHALYHMKVKELADEFRIQRLEKEKQESAEKIEEQRLRVLEKETHDRIIQSVKLENEKMEQLRIERQEKKKQVREEIVRQREERIKIRQEELHEERKQHVLQAIEESKTWVTRENLEKKINQCLEHETNYNFVLSPTGEKYDSVSLPGCVDTEEGPGQAAYINLRQRENYPRRT